MIAPWWRCARPTIQEFDHEGCRRVELAKDLMRDRESSLSEIALRCGFADQSHFTRVFVHATGVSPGAWRRANGSGANPVERSELPATACATM